MIKFNTGDRVTTKKPHACGGIEWTVTRVGADVKLKCRKCDHVVLLSSDKAARSVNSVNGVNASELRRQTNEI